MHPLLARAVSTVLLVAGLAVAQDAGAPRPQQVGPHQVDAQQVDEQQVGPQQVDAQQVDALRRVPLRPSPLPPSPLPPSPLPPSPLRLGIVGLDTSHAPAFTRLLNDPAASGDRARVEVVAAFPIGTDLAASADRIERFTAEVRALGVDIVDSLDALLARVDGVLLLAVDGRSHLPLARRIVDAKKPMFVDKPLAASVEDGIAIADHAGALGVPWFSASALRFGAPAPPEIGALRAVEAWCPCPLEPTHPDLYWYGVHGVETLYALLGPGCATVRCDRTAMTHLVTATWRDGRTATLRGMRDGAGGYGAKLRGERGDAERGAFVGYGPLVDAIASFFVTRVPPVAASEAVEVLAFMSAAERSARQGGAAVAIDDVLSAARTSLADDSRTQHRPNLLLLIADDWSWPHAGCYGDTVVRTPACDEIASHGVRFEHAFCAAPSCSASRAAILTGQAPHRLREGANLHGFLPADLPVYPDALEAAGYAVGFTGKGWGPGRIDAGGEQARTRNPAGDRFDSFDAFLETVDDEQPFCFWWGASDPHRPYQRGSGVAAGLDPKRVKVPAFLPDTQKVREDLCDYYAEVERFDAGVAAVLATLASSGRADDTLLVVTSDNGMPFPRAKANLYDAGARVPLLVRWPARLRGGHVTRAFANLADLAPTFAEAAGVPWPHATGKSLLPLLRHGDVTGRDRAFVERERHAHVRAGNLGYPCRAVRTQRWLYVQNLRADRWPAGDPEHVFSVGPFGDVDDSPTKQLLLARRDDEALAAFFARAFAQRPAEELYDLARDPDQLVDLARDAAFDGVRAELAACLRQWREATGDPRLLDSGGDAFDGYPYFGARSGATRRGR